jgi:dienelactone hydrolase
VKYIVYLIIILNIIQSECVDLDFENCLLWPTYCTWNDSNNQCEDANENGNDPSYGPYQFSSYNESNGLASSESYLSSTVFYPINNDSLLASIVIVPGAFSSETTIHSWASYYASYGYIAMTIGINDFFNDDCNDLANSLLDGIEVLKQENNRLGSPILNRVDINNFATSGWSIGGGAAQYAATLDSSLKAIIALNPGLAIQDYQNCTDPNYEYYCLVPEHLNHSTPVLIISSEGDIENPTDIDAAIHYSYTPNSTDKMLFELANGNHSTGLNPYAGSEDLGNTVLKWLDYHLLNDISSCNLLLNQPNSAVQFYTNLECYENILGDLNNDYIVNVLDIIVIVNYILDPSINQTSNLDINNDNDINVIDVLELINIILN